MPNSHFTFSGNGSADWTAFENFWNSFMGGAAGAGVTIENFFKENVVDSPAAVPSPPSVSGEGEGYDAIAAIPNFSKEPGVTYRLKFTDDGAASFSDTGYEAAPSTNITHPNGWHAGRQYSIFADNVAGALSVALY